MNIAPQSILEAERLRQYRLLAMEPTLPLTKEGVFPRSDIAVNKAKHLIQRLINGTMTRDQQLYVADILAQHLCDELNAALLQGDALSDAPSDGDIDEYDGNDFVPRVMLYAYQLSEKKVNPSLRITSAPVDE